MPHIELPESLGIRSLAEYRPDTGQHLYELAQTLLRGESPLSAAERELIAAFVSHLNNCTFCYSSHAAAARYLFQDQAQLVDFVLDDFESAAISSKLKLLLRIAACVQKDARTVTQELVDDARANGATDRDIHDTVLIAATFCLFNRYVDGLATLSLPVEALDTWSAMGARLGKNGYVAPKP